MNVLLYYPRLLIALVLRPVPRSLAGFNHWNMAQLFFLWNEPWHVQYDSLAVETARRYVPSREILPDDPEFQRASMWARIIYLFVLFYWPLLALFISLHRGKLRFLFYWNELVNTLFLFADRLQNCDASDSLTLTHMSLYVPLLYVVAKTGKRMPGQKHLMYHACEQHGIPTPRVFDINSNLPAGGAHIVKPVGGFSGKEIVFTSDPSPYFGDAEVIVQEVVRNPPELRRLWNSDVLGTIRMMTAACGDEFELAGHSHLKIPVGDATTDNFGTGNVYAMVDDSGRLSEFYKTRHPSPGIPNHPTTGIAAKDIVVPHYDELVKLALTTHERIAPHLPFFNSDVAITEQGPMLIEINRVPGLPTMMFNRKIAMKFVKATAMAVERIAKEQCDLATPRQPQPRVPPQGAFAVS
jgi:hypothetical protein